MPQIEIYSYYVLTVLIDDPPADRGFAAAAASGLTRLSWLLAADCDLLLLRKSMDQLGGIINGNDPRPLRTVWQQQQPQQPQGKRRGSQAKTSSSMITLEA